MSKTSNDVKNQLKTPSTNPHKLEAEATKEETIDLKNLVETINYTSLNPKENLALKKTFEEILAKFTVEVKARLFQTIKEKAENTEATPADFYTLALTYQDGVFTKKNPQMAFHWFKKAAERNHLEAQTSLGICHLESPATPLNVGLAFYWLDKAAKQGDKKAAFRLNQEFSIRKKLAEEGDPIAQLRIADCYAQGFAVPKDHNIALTWYKKSAAQNNAIAYYMLADYCFKGLFVVQNKKSANDLLHISATLSYRRAQYRLGQLYLTGGEGYPKNVNFALHWLHKAAMQQLEEAHQLFTSELSSIQKNANAGNAQAAVLLACSYKMGYLQKNTKLEIFWLEKASEKGDPEAQNVLGMYYATGNNGLDKNPTLAFKYFEKAAQQKFTPAIYNLGWCYLFGQGVALDKKLAKQYLEIAAQAGSLEAREQLIHIKKLEEELALKEAVTNALANSIAFQKSTVDANPSLSGEKAALYTLVHLAESSSSSSSSASGLPSALSSSSSSYLPSSSSSSSSSHSLNSTLKNATSNPSKLIADSKQALESASSTLSASSVLASSSSSSSLAPLMFGTQQGSKTEREKLSLKGTHNLKRSQTDISRSDPASTPLDQHPNEKPNGSNKKQKLATPTIN